MHYFADLIPKDMETMATERFTMAWALAGGAG
jgi:hypothetical protein